MRPDCPICGRQVPPARTRRQWTTCSPDCAQALRARGNRRSVRERGRAKARAAAAWRAEHADALRLLRSAREGAKRARHLASLSHDVRTIVERAAARLAEVDRTDPAIRRRAELLDVELESLR